MIVVRLMGGLGNQMFQYAFGRSVSENNQTELKLDILSGFKEDYYGRTYSLGHFNIIEQFAEIKELPKLRFSHTESVSFKGKIIRGINSRIPFDRKYEIHENALTFDPTLFKANRNFYYVGYWQNEKYFKQIRKELLKEFTLKLPFTEMSQRVAENIVKTNSVAVHFRNYETKSSNSYFQQPDIHGVLGESYYNEGLNIILQRVENPHLFLFSEGATPVLEKLKHKYASTVITHNSESSHEDLMLMSMCRHQIIANSSFSWWAAWLNQNASKIIIAPKIWFLDRFKNEHTDIVPDNWIRI